MAKFLHLFQTGWSWHSERLRKFVGVGSLSLTCLLVLSADQLFNMHGSFPIPYFLLYVIIVLSSSLSGLYFGLANATIASAFLIHATIDHVNSSPITADVGTAVLSLILFIVSAILLGQISDQVCKILAQFEQSLAERTKTLIEREHFFATILDNLPDIIFTKDIDGRLTFGNQALLTRLEEKSLDTVLGKTVFELLVDDFSHRAHDDDLTIIRTGEGIKNRLRHYTTSAGVKRWTLTSKVPLRDSQQQIIGIIGTTRDITERHQAELALRASENRLRQGMNIARLGIWDWDIATDITTWYGDMFRIYGITPEEFTGKGSDYIGFTREDYREQQHKNIEKAFAKGITETQLREGVLVDTSPNELCIVRPDGSEIYTIGDAVSVIDDAGNPIQMIGVTMDITEHKQLEQLEVERQNLAQQLDKEQALADQRTNMLSILSHELRTPLSIISITIDLLSTYHDRLTSEKRQEKVIRIGEQVTRLNTLLDDFSKLSWTKGGFLDYQPRAVNVEALCHGILDTMSDVAGEAHKLELLFDAQNNEAVVDEKMLYHALTNLISNAVKYSPNGGTVQLKVSKSAAAWEFSVKDDGIGIPLPDRERLFTPFSRASNVADINGTGLGLIIAKEAAESHGGTIGFDSEVNKGSTFTITIPLHSG